MPRPRRTSTNWTTGSLKVYLALATALLTWWLWRWIERSGMIDGRHGPASVLLVVGIPMLVALFLYDPVTDFLSKRRRAARIDEKEQRPGS